MATNPRSLYSLNASQPALPQHSHLTNQLGNENHHIAAEITEFDQLTMLIEAQNRERHPPQRILFQRPPIAAQDGIICPDKDGPLRERVEAHIRLIAICMTVTI